MEPKNYSAIRSILKKEQGEKVAPYVFKLSDTKVIKEYLDKERVTYEVYLEMPKGVAEKQVFLKVYQESRKKRKTLEE
jgi:hypothetical protein